MVGEDRMGVLPDNVRFRADRRAVVILDQTQLPLRTVYLDLETREQMYDAIKQLKVRGAPAIGICAAFCYAVEAGRLIDEGMYGAAEGHRDRWRGVRPENQGSRGEPRNGEVSWGAAGFAARMQEFSAYLNSSRPTAVNLGWALRRMGAVVAGIPVTGPLDIKERLFAEALAIQQEDIAMCRSISEHGLGLLAPGAGILTHCNAGPLATSLYGTALGPILLGQERGMGFRVYADETRPLLQGARLTAYELSRAGVDVTLICDDMASMVMKNGWVDACLVGCDRIAANGDAANKIGSSGVAILAKHYGIPFYVLGPSSTIDGGCATGEGIEIELRDPEEIRSKFYARPMAPALVKCYNPAFDVIDHELITAIVTEDGVHRPPYRFG